MEKRFRRLQSPESWALCLFSIAVTVSRYSEWRSAQFPPAMFPGKNCGRPSRFQLSRSPFGRHSLAPEEIADCDSGA